MNKKPTCIICDLDGVVVDSSCRLKKLIDFAAWDRGDFNAYYKSYIGYGLTVEGDVALEEGIKELKSIVDLYNPEEIFFLTARGDVGRPLTLNWIREHIFAGFSSSHLIMNRHLAQLDPAWEFKEGDHFSQVDYKEYEIKKFMENYEVLLVLDDHPSIIEMYESLNIPCKLIKFENVDCVTPTSRSDKAAHGNKRKN